MNILIDLHHHALAESLLMLFEDRYGHEVYFPAGMEWFDSGIWQFEKAFHGDAVAKQYLEGWWDGTQETDGVIRKPDPRHPWRTQNGVSLEVAGDMQWDIVISTLPHNDAGLAGFAKDHGARFGVQVGNNMQDSRWDLAEFILSSSTLPGLGLNKVAQHVTYQRTPTVIYHQEFSLDIFRHQWPPENRAEVASWVNCFPETPAYPHFTDFAAEYGDEFDFKVYGAYGSCPTDQYDAGNVSLVTEIADKMRAARVGWHTKYWSDGFGHTIHNWFAIGRPVVGVRRYYQDKLAGPLWQEGVTSYDVEGLDRTELATILRRLRDDDQHHRDMSEAAARRFRSIVDFDSEAVAIMEMVA